MCSRIGPFVFVQKRPVSDTCQLESTIDRRQSVTRPSSSTSSQSLLVYRSAPSASELALAGHLRQTLTRISSCSVLVFGNHGIWYRIVQSRTSTRLQRNRSRIPRFAWQGLGIDTYFPLLGGFHSTSLFWNDLT